VRVEQCGVPATVPPCKAARNRSGQEHDEHVMQMNEARVPVSAQVQRRIVNVASMIEEPGHPTGHLQIP